MESNGEGRLHSIDVAEDVGLFISDRSRCICTSSTLAIRMPAQPCLMKFRLWICSSTMATNACLAMSEYELAWTKSRSGGLLMSDDVDWSYAFLDFVVEKGLKPPMLMDRRNVLVS